MRVIILAATFIAIVLISGQAAFAQTSSLEAELARLNEAIKNEQLQIKSLEKDIRDRKLSSTQQMDKMASSTLIQAKARLSMEAEINSLQAENEEIHEALRDITEALTNYETALSDYAQQMIFILREWPGHDAETKAMEALLEAFKSGLTPESAEKVMQIAAQMKKDSRTTHVKNTELLTAEGKVEAVELLSFGRQAFLYQVDDRIGLRVIAPQKASGYRWVELQAENVKLEAKQAFDDVASGQGIAQLPMDVTGTIGPQAINNHKSMGDWFSAGGFMMYPIFAVAIIGVLIILERLISLINQSMYSYEKTLQLHMDLQSNGIDHVKSMLGQDGSASAVLLKTCVISSSQGAEAMEDAIEQAIYQVRPKLNRNLGALAVLASIAPLLGLLGTVTGMINYFLVIQQQGQSDSTLMAGGIAEALLTTAAGLMVAIVLMLGHYFLKTRVRKLMSNAEEQAAYLFNCIVHEVDVKGDKA